jgi:competence protein ComEC
LLYFAGRKWSEGLPCQRSPLQAAGFDVANKDWIYHGQKLLDDRGAEPPPHPLGAATSEDIDWGKSIADSSNFPVASEADDAELKAVLRAIPIPKKVVVRDVGQANFCCLKDESDRIVLYYDVGWPLAFNKRTEPQRVAIDFTRAPIVLSHWDWDHFHYALRPEGRYLKESKWIVPIQKLGPGAARFANQLSNVGNLLGWKSNALTINVGSIAPCTAPSSDSNSSGLAMRVSLQSGRTFLLVGDADYDFVPTALRLPVDGLAATHHGARFPSSWTSIPKPKQAFPRYLVSYGKGNSYRHPHKEGIRKHTSAGWRQMVPTAVFKGIARGDREFE